MISRKADERGKDGEGEPGDETTGRRATMRGGGEE